jgi:hypothetical protein
MTFKLPKEAIGRRVKILMQNVAAYELKITSVTDDEVIGMWDETDEEHVNQAFIMSWSYSARKEMTPEHRAKIKASNAKRTQARQ